MDARFPADAVHLIDLVWGPAEFHDVIRLLLGLAKNAIVSDCRRAEACPGTPVTREQDFPPISGLNLLELRLFALAVSAWTLLLNFSWFFRRYHAESCASVKLAVVQ